MNIKVSKMAFVLTRMFPRNKKHVIQHRKNQFEIVFMYSLQIRPCNHHIHIHHDDWNSKEKECNDDREAWLWLQSLLLWQYKKNIYENIPMLRFQTIAILKTFLDQKYLRLYSELNLNIRIYSNVKKLIIQIWIFI